MSGVQGGGSGEGAAGHWLSSPIPPRRLLWYPEGGHALAGVETEADVFGNCARWLLQHLGQPQQDGMGRHRP